MCLSSDRSATKRLRFVKMHPHLLFRADGGRCPEASSRRFGQTGATRRANRIAPPAVHALYCLRECSARWRVAMERSLLTPALATRMGTNSRRLAESKYDAREVAESVLSGAGL